MATILDELKLKANGAADQANNIQEAVSMMEFDGGGSGGGVMVINDTHSTLDKTWQEIFDAMAAGTFCVVQVLLRDPDGAHVLHCPILNVSSMDFSVTVLRSSNNKIYKAQSATEYPIEEGYRPG